MTDLVIKPLPVDRLKQLLARHLKSDADTVTDSAPEVPLHPIFDDEIYLSTFERVDEEGAAWLSEYLAGVRRDDETLARLLSPESQGAAAKGEAAKGEAAKAGDAPGYDAALIAKVAHKLAGASLSAGAARLGEAARALEMAALGHEPRGSLEALQGALHDACGATEAAIAQFLAPEPEHASD
jgi:HPt (histidine-containing phosphotransfer) domain-containing protein